MKSLKLKSLLEGRMNIRGVKNVSMRLGNKFDDYYVYSVLNAIGWRGYPNSSDDPNKIDFLLLTRMHDNALKIVMKPEMAKDPEVQKRLKYIKKGK